MPFSHPQTFCFSLAQLFTIEFCTFLQQLSTVNTHWSDCKCWKASYDFHLRIFSFPLFSSLSMQSAVSHWTTVAMKPTKDWTNDARNLGSQQTAKMWGVEMNLIGKPCLQTAQTSVQKQKQSRFGACCFHEFLFDKEFLWLTKCFCFKPPCLNVLLTPILFLVHQSAEKCRRICSVGLTRGLGAESYWDLTSIVAQRLGLLPHVKRRPGGKTTPWETQWKQLLLHWLSRTPSPVQF